MSIPRFVLLVLFLLSSSSFKVRVEFSPKDKSMSQTFLQDLVDIKLMLDANGNYIYSQQPNVFQLYFTADHRPPLTEGVHIIEAISNQYLFPVLMIDKRGGGAPKMRWLHPYDRKVLKAVNQPVLMPIQRIKYFEPESGISVTSFLASGNGIFILMGIMMVICYKAMPKIDEIQMAPPAAQN